MIKKVVAWRLAFTVCNLAQELALIKAVVEVSFSSLSTQKHIIWRCAADKVYHMLIWCQGEGACFLVPREEETQPFFKGILIWCLCFYSQGKCQRRDPPCKYFHPPQHLRELLLQNGRNNLILKNMQLQLLQQQLAQGAMLPGLSAALAATASTPSVASPGAPGTHGITGAPQCPNPTSPVSSASIGPTVSDLVRVCHPITP